MALTAKERKTIKEAIVLITRETAADGDKLSLRNFGTFKRIVTKARTARNPQTGASVAVPAKSVLRFTSSKKTHHTL